MIDGATLIAWGFRPGKWFQEALPAANRMRADGRSDDEIFAALQGMMPVEALMRTNSLPYSMFLDAENDLERANADAIEPYGSIMAGDWEQDAPWRRKNKQPAA